jgi:hypothetical protein
LELNGWFGGAGLPWMKNPQQQNGQQQGSRY